MVLRLNGYIDAIDVQPYADQPPPEKRRHGREELMRRVPTVFRDRNDGASTTESNMRRTVQVQPKALNIC